MRRTGHSMLQIKGVVKQKGNDDVQGMLDGMLYASAV